VGSEMCIRDRQDAARMSPREKRGDESALLVFVCTGNICRSPMAAAIARDYARRQGYKLRTGSAGTAALVGSPATELACDAMFEIGLDISSHRARPIDASLVNDATLVVTATAGHRGFVRGLHAQASSKIVSFDDITEMGEIDDPIYGGMDEYRSVRDLLVRGMPRVLEALKSDRPDSV